MEEIGRDAAQGGTWDNATIDGKSVQIATVDDYLALRNNENVFTAMVSFMEAHRTECRWQSKTLTAIITMIRKRKPGKGQTAKAYVECSSTTKRPATKYSSLSAHPVTEDAEEKAIKGENTCVGKLRYANRFELYNSPADEIKCRPLFYRLYLSPGAIYWVNEKGDVDGTATYSRDMNYDSFNFNGFTTNSYDGGAVGVPDGQSVGGSDACYVRCVTDTKPLRLCGRRLRQRNVRIRRSYSVNSGNSGRRLDTQASAVKAGCLQVDSEINAEVPVAGRRRKIVAIYGQ